MTSEDVESATASTPLLAKAAALPDDRVLVSINNEDVDVRVDNSWKIESKLIMGYSLPLIGTYLLQYFYNMVIIFAVGRLGTEELAAVSIGITTMNICGFAVFEGLATSLDTLCAQAYGAGNIKLVGVHVQRMVLFLLVIATIIGAIWIYSPFILSFLVPHKNLAVLAGSFLRYTLIGVPGYAIFEAGKRFLQAQGNFTAALIILIICAPINVALNWLLVFRLQWGVPGAALAAALTNDIRPILLILYIRIRLPWTLKCWPGFFPPSVFTNWAPMIWLSLPGALVNLCEWFAFEILTFSTSYLSTPHLAAQTILATTSVLIWHISFSVGVAMSTRIGQLIGHDSSAAAKTISQTYAIIALLIGLFEVVILLAFRHLIPRIFTADPLVRALVSQAIPMVAVFQFFDATTNYVHAIIRGLGRQAISGWITLCTNYIYAVPLALFVELGSPQWGLDGVWAVLASGLAVITVAEGVVIRVLDWERCVDDAKGREEDIR